MLYKDYSLEGMYDEKKICERGQCIEDREQIKRLKSIALELIKLAHRADSMQQKEIDIQIGNLVKDIFFDVS